MTAPDYDAIVLGAGAAGLMCAAVAGQRGRRVLLLDHADQVGKKILISGGGRCNFTNIHTVPDRYISANPHFAKSALARYTPADFIALVDRHGIAHHEKTLGQLFCDGSAKQVVAMLLDECAKGGVEVRCDQPVREVTHADGKFRVIFGDQPFTAANLVIATGGPSIPKMGASGFAYDLARQFGLKVVEPRPALVPLTLGGNDVLFRDLSGVATPVEARAGKAAFREAALFTHKGLSGPAILQVSSYWRHGEPVTIDFLPDAGRAPARDARFGARPARPPRADARRTPRASRRTRRVDRPQACRRRSAPQALAFPPQRHRRLRQGRGYRRRNFDREPVLANNDGQKRAGAVCGRRSRGCHRVAGRL